MNWCAPDPTCLTLRDYNNGVFRCLDTVLRYPYNCQSMIIDSHTKIYPPNFNNIRGHLLKTDATFSSLFSISNARLVTGADLLMSMNKHQIDMSIIAGIGWTNLEVAKQSNTYLL